MTALIVFGVTTAVPGASSASGGSTPSPAFTILAAIAWLVTLALIAVAVRANWGLAKRLPQWLVTVFLIVIGVLVIVAFVAHTAWIGIAALIAVFATWLWFLARWLFPRMPEVQERLERARDPRLAAEQEAEQAVSAQRGADLEQVLDDVVREEHPEDVKAIEED